MDTNSEIGITDASRIKNVSKPCKEKFVIYLLLGCDALNALNKHTHASSMVADQWNSDHFVVRVLHVIEVTRQGSGQPPKLLLLQSLIGSDYPSGTELIPLVEGPEDNIDGQLREQMKRELGLQDASGVAPGDLQIFVSDDEWYRDLVKRTGRTYQMMIYAEFERWLIEYDHETNTEPTVDSVTSTPGEDNASALPPVKAAKTASRSSVVTMDDESGE